MLVRATLTVCFAFLAALVAAVVSSGIEAGGGGHGCLDKPTAATGNRVEMSGSCFSPTVLRVEPGSAVEWVNREVMAHDVRPLADPTLYTNSNPWALAKDEAVWATFSEEGIYAYFCRLHPGMIGVISVGEDASALNAGSFKVEHGARPAALSNAGSSSVIYKTDAANAPLAVASLKSGGDDAQASPWRWSVVAFALGMVIAGGGLTVLSRLRST